MRDLRDRRIWIAVAVALLSVSFVVAIFRVPPVAFLEDVELDGPVPVSIERKARRMEGLSRFSSDYRAIRRSIEDSIYLEDVSMEPEDGVLHIETRLSRDLFAITDGGSYILYDGSDVYLPPSEDIAFLKMHVPVLEVSSGQLEYIARYGIEKRLSEVIDLLLDIYHSSSYNDRLVGKVKYQGGTGEEFGRLTFFLPGMDSSLAIREKVDPGMVLKSLSVMNENQRVLPTGETREYELKGNTLTELKRIVDGI